MPPRQPMRGLGMETDMGTQAPIEQFWVAPDPTLPESPVLPAVDMDAVGRRAYQAEKTHRESSKFQRLLEDVTGGGGPVLQHTALLLATRIQTLIEQDPEANAYLSVLQQTAASLAIGKRYAEAELAAIFQDGVHLGDVPQ